MPFDYHISFMLSIIAAAAVGILAHMLTKPEKKIYQAIAITYLYEDKTFQHLVSAPIDQDNVIRLDVSIEGAHHMVSNFGVPNYQEGETEIDEFLDQLV